MPSAELHRDDGALRRHGGADPSSSGRGRPDGAASARYRWHPLCPGRSGTGSGQIPYGETRTYAEVAADDRPARGGPRRRQRLRGQPGGGRHPVSSGGARRRAVPARTGGARIGSRLCSRVRPVEARRDSRNEGPVTQWRSAEAGSPLASRPASRPPAWSRRARPLGAWLYTDPTFVLNGVTTKYRGAPADTLQLVFTGCNLNDFNVDGLTVQAMLLVNGMPIGAVWSDKKFTLKMRDSADVPVPLEIPRPDRPAGARQGRRHAEHQVRAERQGRSGHADRRPVGQASPAGRRALRLRRASRADGRCATPAPAGRVSRSFRARA